MLSYRGDLNAMTGLHCHRLMTQEAPEGVTGADWVAIQAAHSGYQAGMEILECLPAMARFTGFYDLDVNADMTIAFPERLLDETHQKAMGKALAPPPVAKSNEIVAESGGMFLRSRGARSATVCGAGAAF